MPRSSVCLQAPTGFCIARCLAWRMARRFTFPPLPFCWSAALVRPRSVIHRKSRREMIIDRQNDPAHASLYLVCDAATLEPIAVKAWHIWYADDSAGVIRKYLFDGNGDHLKALLSAPDVPLTDDQIYNDHAMYKDGITYLDPRLCLAWVEEKRPIRIIRKAEYD